jgi:hypothetical protein
MVHGLLYGPYAGEHSLDTPSSTDQRNDSESRSDLNSSPRIGQPSAHGGSAIQMVDNTYVGATHWASILESIQDIRGIVENEPEMPPSPSPSAQTRAADQPDVLFGKVSPISLEQAVSRLPPRNKTDQLIYLYFRSRFTVQPYIHTTKFQREYDGFWNDHSSIGLLWLSYLASILCLASSISIAKGDVISRDDLAHPDNLAPLATECLVAGDYLSGKPFSVEALMLHGYTELQRSSDLNSGIWAKFGLLTRMAQRLGYHRDPKYLTNITPFQGEIRRRLWFCIEVFDVLFSFQLGMPTVIRDDECDTESPANLYDTDFDENTLVLPQPRPLTDPTSTLYLCYKSRLCRLLRRIIRCMTSINSPAYEEVSKLDGEIHDFHNNLPPSLQIRPIRAYSFGEHTFDIMHRLMLEMMYLRSLCVLHRPYLTRQYNSPRYAVSRATSTDAALRILHLHAEYEEESKAGGRLFEDRYMLTSLTLHDFLVASMILCLDLTENAPSSPEDRSKKLKALGTSYRMWSERKHNSENAAHATRVVGAILRKISMQEPLGKAPAPPPLRPQPEVRDGSLAILLNNDVQPPPPPPPTSMNSFDQSSLMNAMDFSLDFSDTLPLDNVLNSSEAVNWSVIDKILLEAPGETFKLAP